MGFFGMGRQAAAAAGEMLAPTRRPRIASPWSPGLATSIMAADWLGQSDIVVTRDQAMKVPAVVAARNVVCNILASGVLKAFRGAQEITTPQWCYRTDSDVSPYHRMLWTADDLFFTGYALWRTYRNGKGQLVDGVRVPPERWDWDEIGDILLDEEPARADQVLLFLGWDEGLLLTGSKAIRDALDLAETVSQRVRVPQAHTIIRSTVPDVVLTDGTEDPEDDEQRELVEAYVAARRSRNGAVSYLPYGLQVDQGEGIGTAVSLYEQGRNASVLDIARLTGVPSSMLDASQVAASLTYETRAGQRSILHDRIRVRAHAIEARLSLDDVVPRGQRIALDLAGVMTESPDLPTPRED